jgi:hypothetical protein
VHNEVCRRSRIKSYKEGIVCSCPAKGKMHRRLKRPFHQNWASVEESIRMFVGQCLTHIWEDPGSMYCPKTNLVDGYKIHFMKPKCYAIYSLVFPRLLKESNGRDQPASQNRQRNQKCKCSDFKMDIGVGNSSRKERNV